VAIVCAVLAAGCAYNRLPRIDPSGERIFIPPANTPPPSYWEVPGPIRSGDCLEMAVAPQEKVAQVGTEVVLAASVRGQDEYMRTNERVEWTIAPGGVGNFVEVDKATPMDVLVGDFTRPRKVDATFAITSTTRRYLRLSQGTPSPADDACIRPGQAWISVTSAVEGTTVVTAYAPNVYGWDRRVRSATIHWVDACWTLPPPAINPAGSRHVLSTTVTRQSDQSPCVNWRVRYEILDGPPAGFAPAGATSVEVPTDEAGRAAAEMFQTQPAPGTNKIGIQIIRPAELSGSAGKRLVVGSGTTLKTWSAADLGLRASGPAAGSVGAVITYRLQVSNPGDLPADDVLVTASVPPGLTYRDSNPPATPAGASLQWRLGRLTAGESRSLEVNFVAQQQGTVSFCGEAAAAGGLKAKDCVTTAVGTALLDLKILGPERATVGDQVTFELLLTNRGQVPAAGVIIKDTFDAGLEHAEAPSPIERELPGGLSPGQTKRVGVAFRVTRAGQLCQTVQVTAAGGAQASARACLTATERPGVPGTAPAPPAPSPQPPGTLPPGTSPAPSGLSVRLSGPSVRTLGEMAEFSIEVTNGSAGPLTNLKITGTFDRNFDARQGRATQGVVLEGDSVYWTLPTLAAGNTARFQLHMRCVEVGLRACLRAQVTSQEGARAQDEKCLEIRPAAAAVPSNLELTIEDRYNPIPVGKEKTFILRVVNRGQTPERQVSLSVTVPVELAIDHLRTVGPTDCQIEGSVVRYQPVASLAPGESLEYRVRVRARQEGDVAVRAELTSQSTRLPVVQEKRTLITPQQG